MNRVLNSKYHSENVLEDFEGIFEEYNQEEYS
jgi:hypothetical protein